MVACSEKDNGFDNPADQTAKVHRIYKEGTIVIEVYNPVTDTYDTMPGGVVHTDRMLWCELQWSGNRLEYYNAGEDFPLQMFYGSDGRLDSINGYFKYRFHHDAEGRVANYVRMTIPTSEFVVSDTMLCTYSGNHLTRLNQTMLVESNNITNHDFSYTWAGDNLTSTEIITSYVSGGKDTSVLSYTYTDYANPMYGLAPFLYYGMGINFLTSIYSYIGMHAKLPSKIINSNGEEEWTLDYTVSGNRVTGCHIVHTSINAAGRAVTETNYDFEYMD